MVFKPPIPAAKAGMEFQCGLACAFIHCSIGSTIARAPCVNNLPFRSSPNCIVGPNLCLLCSAEEKVCMAV